MDIVIRGDKVKVTPPMHEYVEEKIGKLSKYIENNNNVRATVTVKVKNHSQKVEVTIPLKSLILRAEDEERDFYAAVDMVLDKLERQIRKNKTRLEKKSHSHETQFIFEGDYSVEENISKIVKRKKIDIKPMNEEEAILQMELSSHQFYLYKDDQTNKPTVVYKRHDGDYGIIESE